MRKTTGKGLVYCLAAGWCKCAWAFRGRTNDLNTFMGDGQHVPADWNLVPRFDGRDEDALCGRICFAGAACARRARG